MSTTHDVINPATEEVVTTLDLVGVEETDAAIAKAVEVGPAWRAVSPADRGMLLRRFADVVEEHTEELARLEVTNAGHTIGNARWEAGNVVNVLRYYSAAPERLFGRQIPVPVASTSPSRSRSASSRSSCRGTSRCPSPDGASPRHSRPGTRSSSSRPS
jgi:NAD-dependent aldehyde dehydrogenases